MTQPPQEENLKLESLTRDELKKIEKSIKRPEFMGLLNEYMVQISDPKNKAQYDEYLRQLQSEKQLPKHMKIVQIKPKFCFRTFIVSAKNKKHQMKMFVNMCESEYLQKPSCEPTQGEDGKIGYSWKVPNSMGKIRYDQDKKGSPCQVVDIAFHPDTYMFASKKEFQEMMINIALEATQRQLGERKETLSRDYVLLKNVICKGQDGKPALMPIRLIAGKMYNKGEGPTNEPERDTEGRETKLQRQINNQRDQYQKQKGKDKNAKPEDQQQKVQQMEEKPKLVVDMDEGVHRPKYSTIYTYPVDYSQFMDNPYNKKRKIPAAFNIQFAIPRIQSMDEVAGQTLEINDKKILLKIGEKYFIDLELEQLKIKYALLTSNAKAKYDKKKKCLRIIIPVDQTVNYQPEKIEESNKVQQISQSVVQNQTWKNKILDFTEPNAPVKMLQQSQQIEAKPKLVEQIDDQDIIEQVKSQPSSITNQDDEEQVSKKTQKKFTMSNYYAKPKQQSLQDNSKRIGHLFQETSDKVVLVIQMKNYKKEEVKFLSILDQQFLIIWDRNPKGEHNSALIKYQHLKLANTLIDKIQKVDAVLRVGFFAIMVMKKAEQKGSFWQKQCVNSVIHAGETEEEKLSQFQRYFEEMNLAQENRKILVKQKQEEEKVLNKQQQLSSAQKTEVSSQGKNIPQPVTKEEPSTTHLTEPIQRQIISQRQQLPFQNLQPQFILFNAPFIDLLD